MDISGPGINVKLKERKKERKFLFSSNSVAKKTSKSSNFHFFCFVKEKILEVVKIHKTRSNFGS